MTAELRVLEDSRRAAGEAADLFLWAVDEAVSARHRCAVALSGGQTPRLTYERLADEAKGRAPWDAVEFFFGDERGVPPDHPESNYRMARESLFEPLKIATARVHRMAGEAADVNQAARDYETLLRNRLSAAPPAWPVLDLILLGLGDDGHTGSLFPGSRELHEASRAVVPTVSPRGVKARVSLTMPVFNHGRLVVFLVTGEGKAKAARAVLEDEAADASQWPAKLVKPVAGRLVWILDRAAASELTITKRQVPSDEE
jgi:6-phosphogluconolactonase